MAFDDWAALWSSVTGVKSKFEDTVSWEPLPPSNDTFDFKTMFSQTAYFVNEFGYTGGDPDVIGPEEVSCLHLIRHWDICADCSCIVAPAKRDEDRSFEDFELHKTGGLVQDS